MGSALGTLRPIGVGDIQNAAVDTYGGRAVFGMYTPPATATVTLHTFTTAGSGATGTATSTTQADLGTYQDLDIYADITLGTGAATNSLLVFVDGRQDGTTFVNIGQFAVFTTISRAVMHLTKRNPAGAVATVDVDAGAGTVRAFGFGDAVRIRRQITGTATTQFSASIFITNLMQ